MKTALAAGEKQARIARKAFKFADLSAFSFGQRLVIRLISFLAYWLVRVIGLTLKFEVRGWENWTAVTRAGHLQIQAFWHEQVLLAAYFFRQRGIVIMVSQSFDGEYGARFAQRFGYGAVRGSSTRGGTGALVELIRLMKASNPAGFLADGPKGPRRVAKEGALLLAKKTGNPVVPFAITPEKFWTINSWDKMQIPRPFTRVSVVIAPPIYVSANADDAEIAIKRTELQAALETLSDGKT